MMLQIDHRESHDVDIFLPDPQLLGFLNPATHDFEFEVTPPEYNGDGTGFLKLAFQDIGEIDFIVATTLTYPGTIEQAIKGRTTRLETVPEIIAKKIHYRGANIKPRDIFDLAAAGHMQRDAIIAALKPHHDKVSATLQRIALLNPDFVANAIADLAIKDAFKSIADDALARAKALLEAVLVEAST
jgi:hypothetical protein